MVLQDHLLGRKAKLARAWSARSHRVSGRTPVSWGVIPSPSATRWAVPWCPRSRPSWRAWCRGPTRHRPSSPRCHRPDPGRAVHATGRGAVLPGPAPELIRAEARECGAQASEVQELEETIDGALLMSFDLYTACREQVQGLRSRERQRQVELMTPGRPSASSGTIATQTLSTTRTGDSRPAARTVAGRPTPSPPGTGRQRSMNVLMALGAVILLALVSLLGAGAARLHVLFGVILPGAALVIFVVGLIWRVVGWARVPVPFKITTTCGQQRSLAGLEADTARLPARPEACLPADGAGGALLPFALPQHAGIAHG